MRFKEVLKKYGVTQIELAERMGINRVSVSRLFRDDNDMRASTIEKVAKAIGCTAGELFDDAQNTSSNNNLNNLYGHVEYNGVIYPIRTLEDLEKLNKIIYSDKNNGAGHTRTNA